jgi:DNA-binding GntR family transcriptional regulator
MAKKRPTRVNGRRLRPQGTLSESAYNRLVDRIIRGRMTYGDSLNIRALAKEFGVSSIPIRDAIKRLETENLVVVRPRSICYVRVPTQAEVLQAVESRQMLEMFALEKAYRTVTSADLAKLRTVVERMAKLVEHTGDASGPVRAYIELDHQFHAEVCRLAGNEYLQRFYQQTSLHLSMSYRYGESMCHGMRATFAEHQAIYRHLAANSERAVEALRGHLEKAHRNILEEHHLQTAAGAPGSRAQMSRTVATRRRRAAVRIP